LLLISSFLVIIVPSTHLLFDQIWGPLLRLHCILFSLVCRVIL
jgi:hypothetical protein